MECWGVGVLGCWKGCRLGDEGFLGDGSDVTPTARNRFPRQYCLRIHHPIVRPVLLDSLRAELLPNLHKVHLVPELGAAVLATRLVNFDIAPWYNSGRRLL
jgi:hypothetical protein